MSRRQGFINPPVGDLLLAVEALGVYAEEDIHAMPGPFGDIGGRDAGIEPEGDSRVPEVVRPLAEGRGDLGDAAGTERQVDS
ncbi:hypothetical protein Misp02_36860 [Microtetraspora sp. NBRC 16547]|nr:hypothetical protein Misp02_36860 [Microtetraspora sp. NBRC 16547]